MGAIGDAISQPIPAVGTPGTSYAAQLVDFLAEVKARLEANVPLYSLLIGPLEMSGNSIYDIGNLTLYPQADVPTTPTGSLQLYNNDLWWVSSAGAFAITSGDSLNASSLAGFTGDYGGSNPAQAYFSDTDQTFSFFDDFGAQEWARVAGKSFDLYGEALASTTRVRIAWAGSSNPSYTLTLPAVLPGTRKLLQLEDDGTLVTSGVLDTDESVTLSGTGRYKFSGGSYTVPISRNDTAGNGTDYGYGSDNLHLAVNASGVAYVLIRGLRDTDVVTGITVWAKSSLNNTTYSLVKNAAHDSNAFTSDIAGTPVTASTDSCQITPTSPITMTAGISLYLKIATTSGSSREFVSYTVGYNAA